MNNITSAEYRITIAVTDQDDVMGVIPDHVQLTYTHDAPQVTEIRILGPRRLKSGKPGSRTAAEFVDYPDDYQHANDYAGYSTNVPDWTRHLVAQHRPANWTITEDSTDTATTPEPSPAPRHLAAVPDDRPEPVNRPHDPYKNNIQSITPAQPGWTVEIVRTEFDRETKDCDITKGDLRPVLAWALVRRQSTSEEWTQIEPVFLDRGFPVHATEYRRRYANLTPEPGELQVYIDIEAFGPNECRNHDCGLTDRSLVHVDH